MERTVETIGRYELTEELGRGSMGIVHRAHDPVMGRDVAIKTILIPHGLDEQGRDEYQERFLREARAAGALSHPGIVTIYDFDRHEDGLPFIAMEFVEGPTLHELICHEGALKPDWAIDVASTLADALDTAHAEGIVHRDLKPANVLVRAADGVAKITDFGVARISRSDLTQAGVTYGSPAYIAPECLRGQRADGRSDLFALAVMLYEMVSGDRPFAGDDFASVCHAICNEAPRPIGDLASDLSPAFNKFFGRALDKDPEQRFQSGAELVRALGEVREQQSRFEAGARLLRPREDAPEPLRRMDPDRPDAAARRLAAMGRTGELVSETRAMTSEVETTCPIEIAVDPASTGEDAPVAEPTVAVATARPTPASSWTDDPRIAAAVALLRRQPAIVGGIALGILLLLVVAIAGGHEATATPSVPAAVATAAIQAEPEPPATPAGGMTASSVTWAGSSVDDSPFGLPAAGPLSAPDDPSTVEPTVDDAFDPTAADVPVETLPQEPEAAPQNGPATFATPAAVPVREPVVVNDTNRPKVAEITPRTAPATVPVETARGPVPGAVPSPAANTVPLQIELRSGLKDGSLVLELDGSPIYSAELAADSRGFRRAMRKAIRRDETTFSDTIHVPAGSHEFVVRVVNNVRQSEHEATLEASIEPGGPQTLRITAGRLLGKRVSIALVD